MADDAKDQCNPATAGEFCGKMSTEPIHIVVRVALPPCFGRAFWGKPESASVDLAD